MLLEAAIAEIPRGEVMMGSRTSSSTVTLLQDDHEFGSRVLKKDMSNRGRFSYKSSAAMQGGGGVPFQWESEPGKPKSLATKDEDEYKPPVTLSPIRTVSLPNGLSPSRAQSPSSSRSKVRRSLVMNVKGPESLTNNSPESPLNRSPSSTSSPRERKTSLSALYGSLQGSYSPHSSATPGLRENSFNIEDDATSTPSHLVYRSPMLYSPYTPSPYYFSPLSNTSPQTPGIAPSHISIANGSDSHAPNSLNPSHGLDIHSTHTHAPSNSNLHSSHGDLPSTFSHTNATHMEVNELPNASDSLSFASPEMEILDEGVTTNYNAGKGANKTMAEFIKRGGPMIHRSFSASRVTFADDYKRKSSQGKKYYSAQLNAPAQPKAGKLPVQDPTCSALDKLFPLKRPNEFKVGMGTAPSSQLDKSRKEHVDESACSNKSNGIVGGMNSISNPLERAAQEVIVQASDEEGYAYTPVASAFVFSPRRAPPQNTSAHFMRSSSASMLKERAIAPFCQEQPQLKSILKKTSYSHELGNVGAHTENLHRSGSPKISSVLLRFAEAQERLYNSAPASPHHHPSHHYDCTISTTTCLPMCSFLGKALLCRSKLVTRGLHE